MKHLLFLLVKIFPAWAVPLSFLSYELGLYFKRRANSIFISIWGFGVFLIVCSGLWLVFRGDLNSDQWVRSVLDAF